MKRLISYGSVISAVWLIVFIFRFEFIIDLSLLFYNWFILKISGEIEHIRFWDISTIDHFVSLISFLIVPFILIRYRRNVFRNKSHLGMFMVLTGFAFIFAPLITKNHPEFHKNIGVTKLLSPLSEVVQININNIDSQDAYIINKKMHVLPQPFDHDIIFADSVKRQGSNIIYFQKEIEYHINNTEMSDDVVTKKTFLLGTDELGRDTFTRLFYGARISLVIGFGAVVFAFFVGSLLGFSAGYSEKWIDMFLNRVAEMFLTVPSIFFVILLLALLGNNVLTVIIVLGLSGWMSLFKVIRGEVHKIKNKDFFITAKMLGVKKRDLFLKEVMPVILVPVTVNLIFLFGSVVLAESALSFLGLGTGSNYPSWGSMIDSGKNYIETAWWLIVFPGLALFALVFNVNSAGRKLNSLIVKVDNDK